MSATTNPEGEPMRVVAMFRVSTEKQAEQGASLDAQERAYHELAAKEGWHTVATFKGCESATQATSDRRVLGQVLHTIRENAVDAVWVYEQSRLTRGDEMDVAQLQRELREQDVKVIVLNTVRDLNSIDESFMFGIQTLVDRAESNRIKERMGRGRREKARKGLKNCGASPYGYTNPPAKDPKRGKLQIVEDEALVVRRVFNLSADGNSDLRIAKTLNDRGIPSPRGGQWGKTTIRRMLDNPAYIGTLASGVWQRVPGTSGFVRDYENPNAEVVENAHEPIIDRETWDAVHSRVKQAPVRVPRMLTGILNVNGIRFGGDSNHGVRFYRASDRRVGSPWIENTEMDRAVWDAFTSLATGPEFVERLMEESSNSHEQVMLGMEIEHTEDQLAKEHRRYDRLVEMRTDGEFTKDEFVSRAAKAKDKMAKMEAELRALRAKHVVYDGSQAARLVKAVQMLLPGGVALTPAQKRRVLRSIVTTVDVEAERVERDFNRDEDGRIVEGRSPRWAIRTVAFTLALPPADAACGVAAGRGDRGATGVRGANGGNDGARRARQRDTTSSSSAPPAPARP
ncbi:MAG: recombinase family protein [Phycisphaerales bacterium JB054]